MALQEIADICIFKTPCLLSLSKLRSILYTYGPNIYINQYSSIGSTFLSDVLKARYVKESIILSCVKELVNVYNANLLIGSKEESRGQQRKKKKKKNEKNSNNNNIDVLPPLVIASARGMSSIVKFILTKVEKEEQTSITNIRTLLQMKGTSRFRLLTNPKKSLSGTYTSLEFAQKMKEMELLHCSDDSSNNGSAGSTSSNMKSLDECIKILLKYEKKYIYDE